MKTQAISSRFMRLAVAVCGASLVLLAAGCSSVSMGSSSSDSSSSEVKFPEVKDAWLKNGAFVNLEQLRRVGKGMNEDQVRALISYPHFNEGFFHPRVWNYVFNMRTGAGDAYRQCQFQVQYDRDMLTEAFFWRDPACAELLKPQVSEVVRKVQADVLMEFVSKKA